MLLSEFAERVDDLFRILSHAEPDAWDFALAPDERSDLLRRGSHIFRQTFNGLVGEATDEIARVYLLVFPERSLVEDVIDMERGRGGPGSVIVTHHPVDMETSGRGFIAIPAGQLDELRESRISLYVLHAPLDCHPEISTSGAIADGLGLTRERTFASYACGDCGVIAEQEPEQFSAFAERVRTLCELPSIHAGKIRFSGRQVSRIGIVAGGGDDVDYIKQAEKLGCDTFLAGHWWTPHEGEWCDRNRFLLRETVSRSRMNFLSASHDGSELVVFRDRLAPLFKSWGLEVNLLRQADHWR